MKFFMEESFGSWNMQISLYMTMGYGGCMQDVYI